MTGNFLYGESVSYLDTLPVANIGECCISASNDIGEFYYLITKTKYGMTKVFEYGPYIDGVAPDVCIARYSQFQYSEHKIETIIKKFLLSHYITQAFEVKQEDIFENLVDVKEYLEQWR